MPDTLCAEYKVNKRKTQSPTRSTVVCSILILLSGLLLSSSVHAQARDCIELGSGFYVSRIDEIYVLSEDGRGSAVYAACEAGDSVTRYPVFELGVPDFIWGSSELVWFRSTRECDVIRLENSSRETIRTAGPAGAPLSEAVVEEPPTIVPFYSSGACFGHLAQRAIEVDFSESLAAGEAALVEIEIGFHRLGPLLVLAGGVYQVPVADSGGEVVVIRQIPLSPYSREEELLEWTLSLP